MKKIAFLTNIIPPYRLPVFNGISKKHKLDVLICKDKEANRQWKLEGERLFNTIKLRGFELSLKNDLGDFRFLYLKFTIIFYLLFKRPDYIIIGDASFTSYLAAFVCKMLNIKYIWWNQLIPYTPINKGFVHKLRKFSYKHAYHHLVAGTLAKEYIKSFGIDEKLITIAPDAIDNQVYINYFNQFKSQREELRQKYNINKDDFVFLYIGQFIKRKNMFLILEGFLKAQQQKENIKLFLVGGGEEELQIKEFIEKNNLTNSVIVLDFLQLEELSKIYTLADALVLLSESEPWGKVVNEAMCFGLPIFASYTIGATPDLVDDNTGIVVDEYKNIDILSNTYIKFTNHKWDKQIIQNKILSWNNETSIARINKVVDS